MQRSTERILTTHTGSLPRPDDLIPLLYAQAAGEAMDEAAFAAQVRAAVADVVRQQVDAGLDVINDGEAGKVGYSTYVATRLTGFAGEGNALNRGPADLWDFPTFAARRQSPRMPRPACVGPVTYSDQTSTTSRRRWTASRPPRSSSVPPHPASFPSSWRIATMPATSST